VEQQNLFKPVPIERLALQTKEDLILFVKLQQEVNDSLQRRVDQLEALQLEKKQKVQLPSLRYPDAENVTDRFKRQSANISSAMFSLAMARP